MLLSNIAVFLQIVEKGSLAGAARETGLSPTTVSERLASLEAHYGVVLLNRTTRSLSLTDEGRALVEGAREIIGEVETLESRIRHGARALSGPIRVTAPSDIGRTVVSPTIAACLDAHPSLEVELQLSDGYVDVVREGFDIAVRFGHIADSTLRARRLGDYRLVVCAAPSYLERRGTPSTPNDLKTHNCLLMRFGANRDNLWRFGEGPRRHIVAVKGDRIANDSALARQWALSGRGIIRKSIIDVGDDLRAGRLVELLADYPQPTMPLQIVLPPGRSQPRRVRALVDLLAEAILNRAEAA